MQFEQLSQSELEVVDGGRNVLDEDHKHPTHPDTGPGLPPVFGVQAFWLFSEHFGRN